MSIYPPSCCSPLTEMGLQGPAGPAGADGTNGTDGADGSSAFTSTTAAFIQPVVGGTVTVPVVDSTWMSDDLYVYIANGGYYQIQDVPTTTSILVSPVPSVTNVCPGVAIPINSTVVSAGIIEFDTFVNVKAFCAKGDGTTDDTDAVQSAINYLLTLGGGTIWFPVGIYIISSKLIMYANVTLMGTSWSSIIRVSASADISGEIISLTQIEQAKVVNLFLDGNVQNRLTAALTTGGVYITNSRYCLVDNCKFDNFGKWSAAGGNIMAVQAFEANTGDNSNNLVRNSVFADTNSKTAFGIRVWTDWTINQADAAYLRLNIHNVFDNLQFVSGLVWNGIEVGGPASIYNKIVNSHSVNHAGYGAFDLDKGCKYNKVIGCTVKFHNSVNANVYGYNISGEPGLGAFPDRYAEGNQYIGCLINGITCSGIARGLNVKMANNSSFTDCHIYGLNGGGGLSTSNRIIATDTVDGLVITGLITESDGTLFYHTGGSDINNLIYSGNASLTERGIAMPNSSGSKTNINISDNNIAISDAATWGCIEVDTFSNLIVADNNLRKITAYAAGDKDAIVLDGASSTGRCSGNFAENLLNLYDVVSPYVELDPKSSYIDFGASLEIAGGAVGVLALGGGNTRYFANGVGVDTEINGFVCPRKGVIKNLRIASSTAPAGADTYIAVVRINGVNTGIAATMTGAATSASNLTNESEVAAGDLLTVRIISSATAAVTANMKIGLCLEDL